MNVLLLCKYTLLSIMTPGCVLDGPGCPFDCVGVEYGCWGLWMGLFVFWAITATRWWRLCPLPAPQKREKHTHTKTNIIFYSITELHLSKLSEMITHVFYLFSLVKRWCVFHKLKYWNHRVYQSVALDAGLFPLFWMACADCMPIQMAAIWRGEEMKQLELRSS